MQTQDLLLDSLGLKGYKADICFRGCNDGSPSDKFEVDTRPKCKTKDEAKQSLLCVSPTKESCDTLTTPEKFCLNSTGSACIHVEMVIICVFLCNFIQILFSMSLNMSIEITYIPTDVEMIIDPEIADYEEKMNDNDERKEPDCGIVCKKCITELFAICIYVSMLMLFLVGLMEQIYFGQILHVFVEFLFAMLFDQVKFVPTQFIIWWAVVRRLGKLKPNFKEWDDIEIAMGGEYPSIINNMRSATKQFLEHKYI